MIHFHFHSFVQQIVHHDPHLPLLVLVAPDVVWPLEGGAVQGEAAPGGGGHVAATRHEPVTRVHLGGVDLQQPDMSAVFGVRHVRLLCWHVIIYCCEYTNLLIKGNEGDVQIIT